MIRYIRSDARKEKDQSQDQKEPEYCVSNDIDGQQRERQRPHFKQVRSDRNYSGRHHQSEVSRKQIGGSSQEAAALLVRWFNHSVRQFLQRVLHHSACNRVRIQDARRDLLR